MQALAELVARHGILLSKRPRFLSFMVRRAQRLYPAFLVAFAIGALIDFVLPVPKIPEQFTDALTYLSANVLFLPGLVPIDPLFTVNWSLKLRAVVLFGRHAAYLGIPGGRIARRIADDRIVGMSAALLGLAPAGLSYVPIRGLCLLGGILLAEADRAKLTVMPGWLGVTPVVTAFTVLFTIPTRPAVGAFILTCAFCAVCAAAFRGRSRLSTLLSSMQLRRFDNISYS